MGYAHNALLTPTLPLYVTQLGGSAFTAGSMFAIFSVSSVLVRPLVGYWVDSWSYSRIFALGVFALGLAVLPWLVPSIGLIAFGNIIRGIAWAGLNTGGYAFLASITPHTRRGEASGVYGGVQSSSNIIFPYLALWLVEAPIGGMGSVIMISAALALVGGGVGFFINQPDGPHQRPRLTDLVQPGIFRVSSLVDPGVLVASSLALFLNFSQPAVFGFLALYAREIGVSGIGWYFTVNGLVNILARPLLGHLSDRMGRSHAIGAGFILVIVGLLLMVVSSNLSLLIVSGILYSTGNAVAAATTMALAIDRSDPQRRGVAMATYTVAFPAGWGLGALIAGATADLVGFKAMYLAMAGLTAIGLFAAAFNRPRLRGSIAG
jgi:MFS family permease